MDCNYDKEGREIKIGDIVYELDDDTPWTVTAFFKDGITKKVCVNIQRKVATGVIETAHFPSDILHRPPVRDKNGEPIFVGDKVWEGDCGPYEVFRVVSPASNFYHNVYIGTRATLDNMPQIFAPASHSKDLSHKKSESHRDSWAILSGDIFRAQMEAVYCSPEVWQQKAANFVDRAKAISEKLA